MRHIPGEVVQGRDNYKDQGFSLCFLQCALHRHLNVPFVWSLHTMFGTRIIALAAASFIGLTSAQYYQRLGGCPSLGCIFPPDQVDFLAGQRFDIRLEVHAPVNGSEAISSHPDANFKFTIKRLDSEEPAQNATRFFETTEPALERWNFTWYEG